MSDRQLTTLDPDISSLLDAQRSIPEAPAGARERVMGRLAVSMGVVGAGFLGTGAAARVAQAAPLSAPAPVPPLVPAAPHGLGALQPAFKLAMSCLVGAAVGGGVIYLLMRHPSAPSSPAQVSALQPPPLVAPRAAALDPAEPREEAAPAFPVVSAAAPQRFRPGHRHHLHPSLRSPMTGAAADEGSGLEAERALLESARSALALGHLKEALGAVQLHARRFPSGQLADARESLYIRALVSSGKGDEARARGEDFHRRFPASIFLPAVDATLQSLQ